MSQSISQEILDAADSGSIVEVCRLLDSGAPVDAVTNGRYPRTPLMTAAFKGHLDVVELLLDRGADPNCEDLDFFSATSLAAGAGHWEVVRMLAARGADIDRADGRGQTVRDYARRASRQDILPEEAENDA